MKLATKSILIAVLLVLGMGHADAISSTNNKSAQISLLAPPPPQGYVTGKFILNSQNQFCILTASGTAYQAFNGDLMLQLGLVQLGQNVTGMLVNGPNATGGVVIVLL